MFNETPKRSAMLESVRVLSATPSGGTATAVYKVSENLDSERERVLRQHRTELDSFSRFAQAAVESREFDRLRYAKLTYELFELKHQLERRAFGIRDDAVPKGNQSLATNLRKIEIVEIDAPSELPHA